MQHAQAPLEAPLRLNLIVQSHLGGYTVKFRAWLASALAIYFLALVAALQMEDLDMYGSLAQAQP